MNTTSAAGVVKCSSSGLIAVRTVAEVSSSPTRFMLRELAAHPLRPTRRRPVMVELVPATEETAGRDRCGRPMGRRTPANAANIALSFPVTTGE